MTAAPDFTGYATRAGLKCADGRTILPNAFKHQDGEEVTLVWQHGHDDALNVLGHGYLRHVEDGMKFEAYFNDTERGQHMKKAVKHGDVKYMSIYANRLMEQAKQVAHGMIREVSLVFKGANPGATIDNLTIVHSDGEVDTYEDEATITTGLAIEPFIAHAESDDKVKTDGDEVEGEEFAHAADKTVQDVLNTLNGEQATAVNFLLSEAVSPTAIKHAEDMSEEELAELSHAGKGGKTLQDVLDTLNQEQATAVNFLLSQALLSEGTVKHSDDDDESDEEDAESENDEESGEDETSGESEANEEAEGDEDAEDNESEATAETDSETDSEADGTTDNEAGDDAVQHDDTLQEDTVMQHNIFDQSGNGSSVATAEKLSKDQVQEIIHSADELGSLKKAMGKYARENGVSVGGELKHGIENLDYLFPDAKLVDGQPAYVTRRMEWVSKVLDGVRKVPFTRIKSVTADITPDEARARGYIKGNMKNEEFFALSKRETTPQTVYKKQKVDRDDVIDITDLDIIAWMKGEMKVMLDEELAGAILVGDGRSAGDEDKIKEDKIRPIASDNELYVTTAYVNLGDSGSSSEELVDSAIMNRQYYKGTGQPTFFTDETVIAAFLTVKDNFGRRIYSNIDEVKTVLRVADIVPVEILRRGGSDLLGIMVNLADYTLGTDRGGQATMFDDFDLNYNKLLYLIETRCSGALTLPQSAVVFRSVAASRVLVDPQDPTYDEANHRVTVPTTTGVVYKDGAGNTLTTGSPVTLSPGQTLKVQATPASGYYFANNVEDQWTYSRRA